MTLIIHYYFLRKLFLESHGLVDLCRVACVPINMIR